jgi:HTH-type transcriptional repressor of NAD biosynthesis genes
VEIAEGHLERENKLLQRANQYLFTDTNALTTYVFSHYYHGKAHPRLPKIAAKIEKRYHVVFLCDTDIPYHDTWDRSGDANRQDMQNTVIADLKKRKIPYVVLSGTLKQRIQKVKKALHALKGHK